MNLKLLGFNALAIFYLYYTLTLLMIKLIKLILKLILLNNFNITLENIN